MLPVEVSTWRNNTSLVGIGSCDETWIFLQPLLPTQISLMEILSWSQKTIFCWDRARWNYYLPPRIIFGWGRLWIHKMHVVEKASSNKHIAHCDYRLSPRKGECCKTTIATKAKWVSMRQTTNGNNIGVAAIAQIYCNMAGRCNKQACYYETFFFFAIA
jgi:hypothetical protein